MKQLTTLISALFFLVIGVSHVWALPKCVGSWSVTNWDNCFGTYTWASGDKYVGGYKDGKQHGQGTFTWATGSKYVGEFKDNKRNGQGTYTYGSKSEWAGDKYVGEHKDGKRHGQGAYSYNSGDEYVGKYKDGKRHGQGTWNWNDGRIWVGEWENGELSGYAITYDASGSINQEGIFKNSKFFSAFPKCVGSYSVTTWTNCFGTYIYTNGDYVGAWKNGKRNGQGTYTFANGNKYVGWYKDGKKHGQGTNTWADGSKYLGEWKDGKKHGQGTNTWADGGKYVGDYQNDKRNGQGIKTWVNGDRYVGGYKDSKRHGQGTYTYANGAKEVGAWENNELNGYGISYYADGRINKEGIFKDNKFQYAENKSSNNTKIAQQTCNDDPTFCTVAQLCSKASTFSGGKKVWRTSYASRKYVEEAKNNGLSCNIPAVVKVEKPKPDLNKTYKVASGTGFYVSNAGHVITNDHVVDGCKDIKVQSTGTDISTVILATDPKNDLALLKASHTPSMYFSISNNDPEELQDVIVAGYPFGDAFSSTIKFTQGVVSSLAGIGNDYSQFQIDAAIQPGNSGGPIVDSYGNILGVAVAKLGLKKIMDDYGVVPENTNFGIKASAVRNLMVGNNVKVKSPQSKTVTTSEKVKSIKAATVHLTCWMTVAQIDKMIKAENGKVLFKKFTD